MRCSALLAAAIGVFLCGGSRRAEARTCTWNGAGTDALFSNSSNWNCTGASGAPGAFDTVTFNSTSTKSCTVSTSATVSSFSMNTDYTGTVTVSSSLTVSGALTVSAGVLAGALPISVGGNWSNASSTTFTNTGLVTLTSTSTSATLTSGGASFGSLKVNGSGGTYTLQDNLSVTGSLTMSNGTLTAGARTVTVGSMSLGGGTFNASSGTTQVGGGFSNTGGTFNANNGTVMLTGSGSLSPGGAYSFNTLTIAASGTYTLASSLLVGGTLSITSGTLAAASQTISVGGNWSNAGTFTFTAPQTVTLTSASSGATITSGGSSFNALTISGSGGTYTLQDALSATGDVTLTAGTLATSAANLSVGGNLNITAGAFTGGTGTVSITGNLAQTGGTYTGGSGSATVGGSIATNQSTRSGADPTLVGYWTLDETASPAADSSATGTSLTWNGSPTATTSVPSSITFTDSHSLAMTGAQYAGSAVLSGISALTPATVTVSAWYKATSVDTNGSEIVSGSNTYGLRITSSGITVMKRTACNSTPTADWIEYRVPETGHLDGNWHQIVGVIVTGSGGGMSAYLDGVVATGNYWVNGTGGAVLLSASSTPTASTAASAAIDWVNGSCSTESYGLIIGTNPSTTGYHFGMGCSGTACAIDDVRVYNRALTSAQVAALSHGAQPSSSTGLLSLAGAMSVTGSASVQGAGTLTLASGSSLAVGTSLTMDGTLNSTGGTIQAASGSYTFKVGSTAAAAPVLNINGLTVKNTDSNGMWINANTSAVTTFTEFDKVALSGGTGNQLLQIAASSLYLSSNGCSFDGSTTYAIKLTSTATTGTGPRLIFGNATCATNDPSTGLCATSEKQDDEDAAHDGLPTTSTGGVVLFTRAAESDTDGTSVGFPTSAFDWNTFTYYSTYATFHDASSGADVIYVRDESGNPLYSWTDPSTTETISGTPQWITSGSTHYLYVAANGGSSNTGNVYRLKDTGTGTTSGTLTLDTSWGASGVYACTCTISSGLSLDATNIYWAATTGTSTQVLMGIGQSTAAKISTSWPVPVSVNVTTSSPTLFTKSSATTLYLGVTARLLQLDVTGTTFITNSKPGTITGRVNVGTAATSGTTRVYAGDSSGNVWAISPTSFTGTNFLWSYAAGSAVTDNYYDASTDTLAFGTSGGKVVVLNGAGSGTGGSLLNTSYPYTLNTSDPITVAPLYINGVLAVATSLGKLYFLDRNTGNATAPNGVAIIKQYNFGPGQSVSAIGYDPHAGRFMVTTSSAANDGRIYYFDGVSDPTSAK